MAQDTFPQVPDVAAFDLLYTSNDGVAAVNAQNRLWVHYAPGWGPTDLTDVAEIIRNAWDVNVAGTVQVEYILTAIRYKNWDNPLSVPQLYEFTDVPGRAGGDPIPFTSAAILRMYTDDPPPSQCYIRHGGIVESQVDGQHLSTAAVTAILDAWVVLFDEVNAVAGAEMVCVSPFEPDATAPNIYRDVALFSPIVTASTVVRRRLGRAASRQS